MIRGDAPSEDRSWRDAAIRLEVTEASRAALERHARTPIAFEVCSRLEIRTAERGFEWRECKLAQSFVKDHDAIPGNHPTDWATQFDVSRWGILTAHVGELPAGGAVVAHDTPGVDMLEGRSDLAVLWDLRVAPRFRRRGVGSALFASVERWAVDRGCRTLRIETQDVNVPACRLYERQGCMLAAVNRDAYPEFPDETQLIWEKELAP